MIDPLNPPTLPSATSYKLQEFLLFSVAVAGHNADSTATSLEKLLRSLPLHDLASPFRQLQIFRLEVEYDNQFEGYRSVSGELASLMKSCGMGCYNARARTFMELAEAQPPLDLATCSPERLEEFYGIGKKTARFFITYTRPWTTSYAILDTHILKWMGLQGYNVPRSTPAGKRYKEIERHFLAEASARDLTPRQLDQAIWVEATRRS